VSLTDEIDEDRDIVRIKKTLVKAVFTSALLAVSFQATAVFAQTTSANDPTIGFDRLFGLAGHTCKQYDDTGRLYLYSEGIPALDVVLWLQRSDNGTKPDATGIGGGIAGDTGLPAGQTSRRVGQRVNPIDAPLSDDDGVPQCKRRSNTAQRFPAAADTPYRHGTVIENAARDPLVDIHRFHLGDIHLLGPAGDPADLVDDPLVGHDDFGGDADKPGAQERYSRQQQKQRCHHQRERLLIARQIETDDQRRDRHDTKQDRIPVDRPMQPANVPHVLILLKYFGIVSHY
jgi:hypothetical protein